MLEGGKKRLLRLDVTGKRFEPKKRANLASPITRVDDIDTPTLELVGDDDAQKAAEFFLNQGTPDCLRESKVSPLAVIKTPSLLKTSKLMDNYPGNQFIQFHQEEEEQQASSSLQTPVVNVSSNPLQSYINPLTLHDPHTYEDTDYPFQMDVTTYQTPIGLSQQSQPVVKPLIYAPPPSYETLVAPSHQLPATVEEISIHHPYQNPNSPSGSSTISSQVHSPAGGYASSQESKRKHSFSDDGSKRKPTKKQQLDALCDKKKFLENRNQSLKDDVSKYERACKRLKTMLYARIQQQRA